MATTQLHHAAGIHDLRPGSFLTPRYRIERELGEGAMGRVFAARDLELDEAVALKVLRRDQSITASAIERFRAEVRMARRVTHRNVARTYDVGRAGEILFLTMELLEGESLATLLHQGKRFSSEETARAAVSLCRGLAVAHDAGVIHRDLKPANIMVCASDRWVITDFGIAAVTLADGRANDGAIAGTPQFMSPEQLQGGPADARTDVFGLGAVLFSMLTGQAPFRGLEPRDGVDLGRALEEIDTSMKDLVLHALAAKPTDRPANARVFAARLARQDSIQAASTLVERASTRSLDSTHRSPMPFVHTQLGDCGVLAAFGFRFVGPPEQRYLAEGLTEAILDLLSRTRGLKVLSAGATAGFGANRDPKQAAQRLGASLVVDGTLATDEHRTRIDVRLVDAPSARVRWNHRFETMTKDVFGLQDEVALRIAESLRLEISMPARSRQIDPRAQALYLRGRARSKRVLGGSKELEAAIADFETALVHSPDFAPALAALADGYARLWFFRSRTDDATIPRRCRDAVDAALERADALPETHLAVARMFVQSADYLAAAAALKHALELAPTFGAARGYLGMLQCEAGRGDEGLRHIELALQIDPSESWIRTAQARHQALQGDFDLARRTLGQLAHEDPSAAVTCDIISTRFTAWERDTNALSRLAQQWRARASARMTAYCEAALGAIPIHAMRATLELPTTADTSLRLRSLNEQLIAEASGFAGLHDAALEALSRAADGALVDVDWLDRCRLLDDLRSGAAWVALRARVADRAMSIWEVDAR